MDEQKILQFMQKLDLTREEAIDLINEDKKVDKAKMNEVNSDLTKEQQQVLKKYRQADRKKNAVNAYGKAVTRKVKTDDIKIAMIKKLAEFLQEEYGNATIDNPSKLISFMYNNDKYVLDLKRSRQK